LTWRNDWSSNEKQQQDAKKNLSEIVKKLEESELKIKITTAPGKGIGFVGGRTKTSKE